MNGVLGSMEWLCITDAFGFLHVLTEAQIGRMDSLEDHRARCRVDAVFAQLLNDSRGTKFEDEFIDSVPLAEKIWSLALAKPFVRRSLGDKTKTANDNDSNQDEIFEDEEVDEVFKHMKPDTQPLDYLHGVFKILSILSKSNSLPVHPKSVKVPTTTFDLTPETSHRVAHLLRAAVNAIAPICPLMVPRVTLEIDLSSQTNYTAACLSLLAAYTELNLLSYVQIRWEQNADFENCTPDVLVKLLQVSFRTHHSAQKDAIAAQKNVFSQKTVSFASSIDVAPPQKRSATDEVGLQLLAALCALQRQKVAPSQIKSTDAKQKDGDANKVKTDAQKKEEEQTKQIDEQNDRLHNNLLELCHTRLTSLYAEFGSNVNVLSDFVSLAVTQLPSEGTSSISMTRLATLTKLNSCIVKLARTHNSYCMNSAITFFSTQIANALSHGQNSQTDFNKTHSVCAALHGLALCLQTEVYAINPRSMEAAVSALTASDALRKFLLERAVVDASTSIITRRDPPACVLASLIASHSLACLRGMLNQSLRAVKKIDGGKTKSGAKEQDSSKKGATKSTIAIASARVVIERSLLRHCDNACAVVKCLPAGNQIWPNLLDQVTQSVLLLFGSGDFPQWLRTPESMLLVIRHYQDCIFQSVGGPHVEEACQALVRMWSCFIHGGVLLRSTTDSTGVQARVAKATRRLLPRLAGDFLHRKRAFPGAATMAKRWPVNKFANGSANVRKVATETAVDNGFNHKKCWTDAMSAMFTGLHDIFEILSQRDKQQLYVQLDGSLKDMMKDLYADFNKHYRWKGDV